MLTQQQHCSRCCSRWGTVWPSQWLVSEIPPTAPLTDAPGLAQAASFTVYILSGIFGLGFITTFVICIVSLMLDFWTVRRCTQP